MRYSVPMRKLWIGALVLGFLLLDAAALLWLTRAAPAPALQFSRETTYILMPRDRHGLPDYRGHLRAQQLGSHPSSSNALRDLHAALGSEIFSEDARAWAPAELGVGGAGGGELIRTDAYARTACGLDHERCKELLDAALQAQCASLSGEALELAAAWLAVNQSALYSLRRASERPVLYVPIDEWARSSLSPLAVIKAQRILACGAALRLRQSDPKATDDVIALWNLSALLRDQEQLLAVIGIRGIESGCRIIRELSRGTELPADAAERLLRSIPVFDERATLIAMINRERIAALLVAQSTVHSRNSRGAGPLPKLLRRSRVVDLGAVLRRVNSDFDLLERAASAPARDVRVAAMARASKVLEERIRRRPSGFEAVACQLSATRTWCTLDRYVADLTAWGESVGLEPAARKLHTKIALIEDTRRALAAQARPSAKGP